jgi:hypothetical protein
MHLNIRRKGGMNMIEKTQSKTVKAGAITYFFDIKETNQGKPFLVITMSRFKGEGEERERSSISIFPEQAEEYLKATQEMVQNL